MRPTGIVVLLAVGAVAAWLILRDGRPERRAERETPTPEAPVVREHPVPLVEVTAEVPERTLSGKALGPAGQWTSIVAEMRLLGGYPPYFPRGKLEPDGRYRVPFESNLVERYRLMALRGDTVHSMSRWRDPGGLEDSEWNEGEAVSLERAPILIAGVVLDWKHRPVGDPQPVLDVGGILVRGQETTRDARLDGFEVSPLVRWITITVVDEDDAPVATPEAILGDRGYVNGSDAGRIRLLTTHRGVQGIIRAPDHRIQRLPLTSTDRRFVLRRGWPVRLRVDAGDAELPEGLVLVLEFDHVESVPGAPEGVDDCVLGVEETLESLEDLFELRFPLPGAYEVSAELQLHLDESPEIPLVANFPVNNTLHVADREGLQELVLALSADHLAAAADLLTSADGRTSR